MKRYALLVGVDCYLVNNGARRFTDGGEVFLPNLRGCINDVRTIETLLQEQYDMSRDDITVLSSSLPDPLIDGNHENMEPVELGEPDRLPTFHKIRREFRSMRDKAVSGDFFFFHFSGHGARLPRVHNSPLSRENDPSLLTVDFCRGKRAVRGWELNIWLKALNEKGVRVVVSLDSCYSGGAWRAGDSVIGYRTPEDWGSHSVVNLATDEDEGDDQPEFRAGELPTSWSLNPENFTLMTACGADQKAAELIRNNKVGGHFTHALLDYLKKSNYRVTYRMALEHLHQMLDPQRPQIHGRDRFLFFGNSEPFSVTPLKALAQGDRVFIPAGRAHGVSEGSEFVPFTSVPHFTGAITIDSVEEFTSSARLPFETRRLLHQHNDTIVVSRWCLTPGSILRVVLDKAFEPTEGFQESLLNALVSHVASAVEVTRIGEFVGEVAPQDTVFTLQGGRQQGIRIRGPEELIGYNDSVRPLVIPCADEVEELAAAVASPLLHLARFGRTLNLNPADSLSFKVSLLPAPQGTPEMPSYSQDQRFTYVFENTDFQDLFLAILNLTPEFGIKQLWPPTDSQRRVKPRQLVKLSPRFQMPQAPAKIQNLLHQTSRREIIRTVVTTREGVSWKMLELPSIWDANRVTTTQSSDFREGIIEAWEADEWSVFDSQIMLGS